MKKSNVSTEPLVIEVVSETDGYAYQLDPDSRLRIRKNVPNVSPAGRLFVGYDTKNDFEKIHGDMGLQIARLLTGLPQEQMEKLGGIEFFDVKNDRRVRLSR